MGIEKPMLDIINAEDLDDPGIAAREPCIPDFILHTDPVSGGHARVVIVETMGFASESYRSRKVVTHEIMASTLNAPVLTHDFHFPAAQTQVERDQHFLSSARWAVTSPEEKPRGSHPGTAEAGAGPPVTKSPPQSQPARSVGSGRGQLERRQRCTSPTP